MKLTLTLIIFVLINHWAPKTNNYVTSSQTVTVCQRNTHQAVCAVVTTETSIPHLLQRKSLLHLARCLKNRTKTGIKKNVIAYFSENMFVNSFYNQVSNCLHTKVIK